MIKIFQLIVSIIIGTIFSIVSLQGQTVDEIKSSSDEYLYGEGFSTTVARADEDALNQLISQIAVTVSNEIVSHINEGAEGENSSTFSQVTKSYTGATITNTERIIIENEPDAHVFRFIRKSEINRIFEARERKIIEMVRLGEKGLSEMKIDNALKHFYWAYALTKSLRYPAELHYIDRENIDRQLITWLPAKINSIFHDIELVYCDETHSNGGQFEVEVKYANEPVASFDYTFFDGSDWSNIYSCRNGVGVLELRPGVDISKVQVKCEYLFENEAMMDPEIQSVMDLSTPVVFRDAYITVRVDAKEDETRSTISTTPATLEQEGVKTDEQTVVGKENDELSMLERVMIAQDGGDMVYSVGEKIEVSEVQDTEYYIDIISQIRGAIQSKDYQSVKKYFTEEGYDIFERLVAYGNAKVLSARDFSFIGMNNSVTCRSIPLSFSFSGNKRTFIENISFTFDQARKINNLTFCLDHEAQSRIAAIEQWDESSRYLIINFLENYKTAYALKRIDYLRHIFADDALIITGRVLVPIKKSDLDVNYEPQSTIRLTKQTKEQYMSGLERVFASNQYVNLKFSGTDVVKYGKGGEVYGIQLKQDYYSTYYGDSGYLFLMVDLNDIHRPVIHVRTWQDSQDVDFGIINPHMF